MARRLEPHPYALLLPPLTEEEYAALKANIERFGILHPVTTDEDERVLDGVHRVKIADELGIEPPVSQMGQLSEQEKLQLAIGVNVRRRHLDADRRRNLVRKLRDEQGLSVREIAAATGWSKSTVGRDLTPATSVETATDDSFDEVIERWEREHPEPRPEDYYTDESDHLGRARYHLAEGDRSRDGAAFCYREILRDAAELAADPYGSAVVLQAHTGIRFFTAERKAEQSDAPEDLAEAEQAWLAYVAARDQVAALSGDRTPRESKEDDAEA
jgi:ParB-like chromosome segregation protein Spo0J